jgi:predicted outer membrane protein
MILRKTSLILAAAATLALGRATFADPPDRPAAPPAPGQPQAQPDGQRQGDAQQQINDLLAQIAADPKTAPDKLFVLTAALHNNSELQLARAIEKKTQNEHVKKLAQQMIDSLQKTHEQIQQTAQAIGLPIPQELAKAEVEAVGIVAALPEDQLDQQYTSHVQSDNAQDLSEARSEEQIAQDPRVRKFAHDEVPQIEQRTQEGDQTAQAMGMPGGNEAQPAAGKIKGENR